MSTVPLSGTDIRLMSGIPFSNDYKHTRWFDTVTDQTNYFLSKTVVHLMDSVTPTYFENKEGKSYVSVNTDIDSLFGTNYLMFRNTSYNAKWFYAFVTKVEYVRRNLTHVHFEIDVFQTWKFEMNFKPSYIIREHCKLWNDDGSPVINTVDEGLNYGSEYEVMSVEQYRPYDDVYFLVIVSKRAMHGSLDYIGSLNGMPQNLCTYVHPFKMDGSVPSSNITLTPLVGAVVNAMYLTDEAINNIVSMYITDVLPDFPTYASGNITFDTTKYTGVTIGTVNTIFVNSLETYAEFLYSAGGKYDGYLTSTESKLYMYPYTVLELTDFKGNKTTYKNEYIDSQNLTISVRGSLGINNKIVYEIKDYLSGNLSDDSIKTMINMDNALIHDNPNDIPVMSDSLAAFIQGNRNSLQNQKNQLVFNATMDTVSGVSNVAAGVLMDNPFMVGNAAEHTVKGVGNDIYKIQGLNAKVQDIKNTPPQMVKMGSNTNFDYGNGYKGLWIIKKQIRQEYRNKLTDFFNMFGYKLNEVKLPNFHTRQNWNFVQTQNCVILADINNEDLNELKSIFNSGITFWHTDDVGNYSLENGVI